MKTLSLADLIVSDTEFVPYHRGYTARNPEHLEFVAWDGEGITPPDQTRQNFVLFGNSKGRYVKARKLTSKACLDLIIATERRYPKAIHVGFAFSYDVEMILGDLDIKYLTILRKQGYVHWRGFRIEYKRGKWFQVGKRVGDEKISCRIWDVFSFFSTSFIVAIQEYLGDIPDVQQLTSGKAGRSHFTYDELDDVIVPYWRLELNLTVQLMNSLRERLYGANLRIRQWHGPGAIATYAMKDRKIKRHMNNVPDEVNRAAQYGYAGGRFELFKLGHEHNGVYAYDIRSAYPAAITQLPSLKNGKWEYVPNPTTVEPFGIYRIRFASKALMSSRPMPFFYRDDRHTIHFPNVVEGWYWSPEAHFATLIPDATLMEGWVFHEDGSRPFAWLEDVYAQRAQWKREGNPSQIALKLLMNSMYGKFAQRVGWERTGKAPVWHQLEWAGFITSHARAKLFRAMMDAYATDDLVGVETDGIFSRTELPLELGPNLGQWDCEYYDEMVYLQSGFYFKKQNGEWTSKYRGFDKGCITVDDAMQALEEWTPWVENADPGRLVGTTTRFSTMGAYLTKKEPEYWRNTWMTEPRTLRLGADGKRMHRPKFCMACKNKQSPNNIMHDLTITYPVGGLSVPHNLPWIPTENTNPFRDYIEEEWYM